MDGHAFLAEIRARDPQVPVIVATGHASLDNAIRALRDGASGMLDQAVHRRGVRDRGQGRPRAGADPPRRAPVPLRHADPRRRRARPHRGDRGPRPRDRRALPPARHRWASGSRPCWACREQERTTIRIGGYLHDVGKIAIADRILLKPGPLTDEEYPEMQRHAEIGGSIVQTHEAMTDIARIVRHHHERFDGTRLPGSARRRRTSRSAPGSSRSPTRSAR